MPVTATRMKADAYRTLRSLIESGSLKQGERLSEAKAAKMVSLKLGPVRQSLRKLEAEGLLTHRGSRRSRVVGYLEDQDPETLIQRYELRECIESCAAGLAALYMNGVQIQQLRNLVARDLRHFAAGNLQARYRANLDLHEFLLANCGNAALLRVWRREHLAPPVVHSPSVETTFQSHMPDGHRRDEYLTALVEGIAAHDRLRGEKVVRDHLGAVTQALRETIWEGKAAGCQTSIGE